MEEEQAELLMRLPPELLKIVGKHSQHWNYSKMETLQLLADYMQREVVNGRISELKELEPPEQWEEFAKLSGSDHCQICGFNAVKFREHIQERTQSLLSTIKVPPVMGGSAPHQRKEKT